MTKWKYFLKIVYRTSVLLIFFLPGLLILWQFIPLYFASDDIENDCCLILSIVFLAAILGTMARTLKQADHPAIIVGKILLTLFVSFCAAFVVLILVFGTTMCGWTERTVLFINKSNSNITIVTREFGCGATDSGLPTIRTVKKRNITPFFIQVTPIDTSTIDKEKWIRVESGDQCFKTTLL